MSQLGASGCDVKFKNGPAESNSGGSTGVTTSSGTSGGAAPNLVLSLSSRVFPATKIDVGSVFTLDAGNGAIANDTAMTYSCVFDQVVDGAVAAGTACTSLPGSSVTFDTTTGILVWTTSSASSGPYEIKLTGTNSGGSSSKIIAVDVRDLYSTTNLIVDYDARFSTLTGPVYSFPQTLWKDLTTNLLDGVVPAGLTTTGWSGTGAAGSPFRFGFNGTGGMNVGSGSALLNSMATFGITGWIKPTTPTSASKIIFTSGGDSSTTNGLALQQDSGGNGYLSLTLRKGVTTYLSVANSIGSVVGYYGLDEGVGAGAITDGSSQAGTGTPTSVVFGGSSGAATTGSTSAAFDGSNSYIKLYANGGGTVPNFPTGTSARSVCAIARLSNLAAGSNGTIFRFGTPGVGTSFSIGQSSLALASLNGGDDLTIAKFWDNTNWKFVCAVYDGVAAKLYGAEVGGTLTRYLAYSIKSWNIPGGYTEAYIGNADGNVFGGTNWKGDIDEVVVFSKALTLSEVQKLFYAAGGGYTATCTGTSVISSTVWTFISALFDGSTLGLYVNGAQECSVAVNSYAASGLNSPATDFYFGASSAGTQAWSGELADLKIYNSSAAGAGLVSTNFSAKTILKTNPVVTAYSITSPTVFRLTGLAFEAGAATKVNGVACISSVVTTTTIDCTVPAVPNDGDVITVNNPSGGSLSYYPTCTGTGLTNVPFASGAGTIGNPYRICTATQLSAISNDATYVTNNYVLGQDIDLGNNPITLIGDNVNKFTGTFDGKNHTISNFNMTVGFAFFYGLFRYVSSGTIKNLTLQVNGFDTSGSAYVGPLVGWTEGSTLIDNVKVTGTGTILGGTYTGGFAGYISGMGTLVSNCSTTVNVLSSSQYVGGFAPYVFQSRVINSTASGTVSGTDQVGGFVGGGGGGGSSIRFCSSSGTVSASDAFGMAGGFSGSYGGPMFGCSATGDVSGRKKIGGFMGTGSGTIEECFATGNVTATTDAGGGFAGDSDGTFIHVYSTGAVGGGGTNLGGLVGTSGAGSTLDCFWDTQTSGQATSAIGTGQTTAQMKTATTFTSVHWDTDVWSIANGSYPMLK